mmetsp:Transcript_22827/g.63099  ORF Transcript_22827/g.63099 Transcript_22827/m.63099 type:complete len:210 (-) Transcript_22827:34-663(-)
MPVPGIPPVASTLSPNKFVTHESFISKKAVSVLPSQDWKKVTLRVHWLQSQQERRVVQDSPPNLVEQREAHVLLLRLLLLLLLLGSWGSTTTTGSRGSSCGGSAGSRQGSQLLLALLNQLGNVLALHLTHELGQLAGVGLHTNGAQDGLHIGLARVGVPTKLSQEQSSDVLHCDEARGDLSSEGFWLKLNRAGFARRGAKKAATDKRLN